MKPAAAAAAVVADDDDDDDDFDVCQKKKCLNLWFQAESFECEICWKDFATASAIPQLQCNAMHKKCKSDYFKITPYRYNNDKYDSNDTNSMQSTPQNIRGSLNN